MLALIRNHNEFSGIIGMETNTEVDGVMVRVGDIVRVAEGSNNNECINIVGVFRNKISVMGLGSTPISELNVVEIIQSHEELQVGSKLDNKYNGDFRILEFKM